MTRSEFRAVIRERVRAQFGHALQLPMAASIILATARDQQARLHTMDSDFRGIAGVEWLGSE